MTDNTTGKQRPGGWLGTEVDGRRLGFWIAVALAITMVVLGFGAWWVWGLNRGTPMGGMDGMQDMPHTDVRLPPVQGYYAGEEIFFVHPEASDAEVAEVLTEMMGDSPVLVVPELGDVPAEARDEVYVFTNGVEGHGPFGFQPDVLPSAPGDADYSPLRQVLLVIWEDEDDARELRTEEEIHQAEQAGRLDLETTEAVVNMPVLTWPDGHR